MGMTQASPREWQQEKANTSQPLSVSLYQRRLNGVCNSWHSKESYCIDSHSAPPSKCHPVTMSLKCSLHNTIEVLLIEALQ